RPRQVVDIQVPAAGRLDTLAVHTGDVVKQGEVLGRIDQAELRQKLHEEQTKLAALQQQDQEKQTLEQQQASLQLQQIALEKSSLGLQRQDVQKRLQDAEENMAILQQRVDNRKRLGALGVLAKHSDDILQAQKAYLENQDKTSEFKTQLKQLESQLKHL